MTHHELNAQQQRVVEELSRDVAVQAGAGTGKTMTLAQRFASSLRASGEWRGSAVDRVLTITFTNKAAAELSERIRRVLLERGDIQGARELGTGWISTVDAFCSRILRRYSLEIGVDPGFQILAEIERESLRDNIMTRLIDAEPGARALADAYGRETLRACVAQAYDRIGAMDRLVSDVRYAPPQDALAGLQELGSMLDEYRTEVSGYGKEPNATQVRNLLHSECVSAAISAAQDGGTCELASLLDTLVAGRFSSNAKPRELSARIKEALTRAQEEIATVVTRPWAASFAALLQSFATEYEAEKRSRGLLDFADVMRHTVELFRTRPDIANAVARQFDLIMVDEFQDTNQAQMSILGPIMRENLCAVGDNQQSIYGFRYADVGVFESLVSRVGGALPLSVNYRSHSNVLAAINAVFGHETFFGTTLQALESGRNEGAARSWPEGAPRVRVCVSDAGSRSGMSARDAQARMVARRVEEQLEAGFKPGEVVVLLRAMSGAATYAEAIRTRGIQVVLASGEAFHESAEVDELKALLRSIIMPGDDHAMARLLLSRLVGLSAEAAYGLHLSADGSSLSEALQAAASSQDWPAGLGDQGDRLRATLAADVISELREAHGSASITDLLHRACTRFSYEASLARVEGSGSQAWANVQKLIRIADRLEADGPADAGTLLRYLADHAEAVPNEPAAAAVCPDRAVRIMSVHAAKGLEFPVVLVADLGRSLASSDAPRILLDRVEDELRLALKCPPDGSASEGARDSWYEDLRGAAKESDLAEEKRIFYVACTRAEECLILVGDAKVAGPSRGTLAGMVLEVLGDPASSAEVELGQSRIVVEIESPDEWGEAQGPGTAAAEVESDQNALDANTPHDAEDGEHASIPHSPAAGDAFLKRISYSRIREFEMCPMRFRLTSGGLRSSSRETGGGALAFGSAVHEVLEAMSGEAPTQSHVDAVAAFYDMTPEETDRLKAATQALTASEAWGFVRDATFTDREAPFSVRVANVLLEGNIDLIARKGSRSMILDYKTGSDREAATSDERVAAYELQAACYALAELDRGASEVDVVFVFLEQDSRQHALRYSAADADRLRQEVGGRIEAIKRALHEPAEPNPSPSTCASCPGTDTVCEATLARRAV